MTLIKFRETLPQIGTDIFISDSARVIGNVKVGDHASIWYNTVIRGDINRITIGTYTNIQDNCTLHVADEDPCLIGDYVTVGHRSVLHGCTIHDHCLVGMGAIVLTGAIVGEYSIIGAGSLITEKKVIPPYSLVVGSPGRIIRTINDAERHAIFESAREYHRLALAHRGP